MKICLCGCGQSISDRYDNGRKRIPRICYIRGHERRGKKASQATRIKIGAISRVRQMGENNSFYGRHHSAESLKKLQGEIRWNWKGNAVGIDSLHQWLHKRKPKPDVCPICNIRPPYDLANVSMKYNPETYNRDLSNWFWVCRKCHMRLDGRNPS